MSRFLNEKLQSLVAYTPGEQPKIEGLIKLNTNENPYPPSPAVQRALDELGGKDGDKYRLYSDPENTLCVNAIARFYGVDSEQVVMSNGSDEILAFAFMAFGKKVYFPSISYGFYPVFAEVFGCEAVSVPLTENFEIDLDKFKNNDGTVVIANPNAPTGIAIGLDKIEELLVANPDQIVLVDEAYVDFGGESAVTLLEKYGNLLVVQTYSKSRALAGMRIGFSISSKEVADDLKRIKFSFNPYNLSSDAIVAAAAAMDDVEYFDKTRKKIIATRDSFCEEAEKLGFEVLPSKANFVFVKTGEAYFAELRKKKILVRHWNDPIIKDWLRVTIGTDEQMATLLKVLEEIKCAQQA